MPAQPTVYSSEQHNAAAREAARYCLLPDPRPADGPVTRAWHNFLGLIHARSVNDLPEDRCMRRQINGKALGGPVPTGAEYESIVHDARVRACIGTMRGQVRDFEDVKDEPNPYPRATHYHQTPFCAAAIAARMAHH